MFIHVVLRRQVVTKGNFQLWPCLLLFPIEGEGTSNRYGNIFQMSSLFNFTKFHLLCPVSWLSDRSTEISTVVSVKSLLTWGCHLNSFFTNKMTPRICNAIFLLCVLPDFYYMFIWTFQSCFPGIWRIYKSSTLERTGRHHCNKDCRC